MALIAAITVTIQGPMALMAAITVYCTGSDGADSGYDSLLYRARWR
jgi:hypothetical protein